MSHYEFCNIESKQFCSKGRKSKFPLDFRHREDYFYPNKKTPKTSSGPPHFSTRFAGPRKLVFQNIKTSKRHNSVQAASFSFHRLHDHLHNNHACRVVTCARSYVTKQVIKQVWHRSPNSFQSDIITLMLQMIIWQLFFEGHYWHNQQKVEQYPLYRLLPSLPLEKIVLEPALSLSST